MGESTGISWTDATWNPVRGCSRVSEGCRNCYAERVAARFSGPGLPYEGLADASRNGSKWTGVVRLIAEHLADPLRWKRPRRIFVNSMSDLFHERLTNEEIAAVFGIMAAAPQHTFQVLTKRAARMREWFAWVGRSAGCTSDRLSLCLTAAAQVFGACQIEVPRGPRPAPDAPQVTWPLSNVWIGVSVENQAAADERIPDLLQTPAAVRFLSCEPLIGAVDLQRLPIFGAKCNACGARKVDGCSGTCWTCDSDDVVFKTRLHWIIAGCESGPGARPCDVAWLRALRDQCADAGVAYFLKQAADWQIPLAIRNGIMTAGDGSKCKAGGVIELPYLDGVQHAEFPEAR